MIIENSIGLHALIKSTLTANHLDLAPISQRTSALGQWATALCSRDSRDSLGKLSQLKIGSFNKKKHLIFNPHTAVRIYIATMNMYCAYSFTKTVYRNKGSWCTCQWIFFTSSHDFSQSKLPWAKYSSCLDRLTKHVQKWPGHIHKPHGQHTEKSNSWINSNEVKNFLKVNTCCRDTLT